MSAIFLEFRSGSNHHLRLGGSCYFLLLATAVGCGATTDSPKAVDDKSPSASSNSVAAPTAAKNIDRMHPVVRVETNMGSFTLRLDAENARGTVQNFLNYVNEGFYTDTIFHYVASDKMVLGGGYTADYQLKPNHGSLRNEAHNGGKNLRGTIAMARDPALVDSANSQFFINLEDAPQRDYKGDTPDAYGYCVFGEVTAGLDVLEKISRAATSDLSAKGGDLSATPRTPVVISSMKLAM
jgi:cyclophilin family peptidyl-prolyl cis-trans isomerase